MHRVAILYATWDGQTRRIALYLADRLRESGLQVIVAPVARVDLDFHPRQFDLIILGGAVRMWRYRRELYDFAERWRDELRRTPTTFYSVSASASSERRRARRKNRACIDRFCGRAAFVPSRIATFAGALRYTRYPLWLRPFMKLAAFVDGAPTDTSRDHELTDWSQVDATARELTGLVRGEPEPSLTTTDSSIRA